MPDITMCSGHFHGFPSCPIRSRCYRHTATPSKNQSWFGGLPKEAGQEGCPYFIPVDREADTTSAAP